VSYALYDSPEILVFAAPLPFSSTLLDETLNIQKLKKPLSPAIGRK